jgi:HEAT repeat protein
MRKVLVLVAWLPFTAAALATPPQPSAVALVAEREALTDASKKTRLAAVQRLGGWGCAASLAAPDLARCVEEDPDVQVADFAALALAKLGPAGAKELATLTRSPRLGTRLRALVALTTMGPAAKPALPVLLETLRDPDAPFRAQAAVTLGEMGPDAAAAVPALCAALRDTDPLVRKRAALALANLGPDAVAGLRELLTDDDWVIRKTALEALALHGPEAAVALKQLIALLDDDAAGVRAAAALVLAEIGPEAAAARKQLLAAMKDDHFAVQQAAFRALMNLHDGDKDGLMEDLRKLNSEGHWAGPYLLTQFGPTVKDAIKPLCDRLQHPEASVRLAAALALARIGRQARAAAPALQQALQDPSPVVQSAAALALVRVRPEMLPDVQPAFLASLDKMDRELARAVAHIKAVQAARDWNTPRLVDPGKVGQIQIWVPPGPPHPSEVGFRPSPQQLAWRKGMCDPELQAAYNKLVDANLYMAVHDFHASDVGGWFGDCDEKCPIPMTKEMHKKWFANRQAIMDFGPEAIPAIVRGFNLAVTYKLGFT